MNFIRKFLIVFNFVNPTPREKLQLELEKATLDRLSHASHARYHASQESHNAREIARLNKELSKLAPTETSAPATPSASAAAPDYVIPGSLPAPNAPYSTPHLVSRSRERKA